MLYLTLDTDVWLSLLKEGDNENEYNLFDELLFWIENGSIIYILPENIKREWERNKEGKVIEIKNALLAFQKVPRELFKGNQYLDSLYKPDVFEEFVRNRINRVDYIFQNKSEIAPISESILLEAAKRNLNRIAPNHNADSFRDSVNIISLIKYIENKQYSNCYFSTINYKDYSQSGERKIDLHEQLVLDFKQCNLTYIYYHQDNLFGFWLRPSLPSYLNYLKDKKQKEEEQKIIIEQNKNESVITNVDSNFLENIKYLDDILKKNKPTSIEESIVDLIINSHESYKKYFLRKVGSNGMV